tara:strand:+ start:3422 stop:3793 length:372 start_codon:yes stop_codon:yes gene_type:complete
MTNFRIYNNNNNLQSLIHSNAQNINMLMTPIMITITEQTTNIDYATNRFDVLNITAQNDVSINITNISLGTSFDTNQLTRQQLHQLKIVANNSAAPLVLPGAAYHKCNITHDDNIVGTVHTHI